MPRPFPRTARRVDLFARRRVLLDLLAAQLLENSLRARPRARARRYAAGVCLMWRCAFLGDTEVGLGKFDIWWGNKVNRISDDIRQLYREADISMKWKY